MKNIKELRELTPDELQAELLTLRKEQFNLRMKKANGSLDKTHLITQVRKGIARLKTILTEKVGKRHV
ncbi:50S ribosomal protein L29 [Legionella jordanis]|uniref:Large ribosomal subunit protein uL29 n=1 Tax=Legionella jordanis TaxID=456 RepID=A0A0W0VBY4_9GAMM|nr:50S ribosomal protein L29 [Legionella jordanis]KTD17637.1 50S ribosomal protein L29 [Legionella jordanis]RMX00919.1 50S ribosomal protein L29 [Legionella jordanis]RMX17868.1 50S ribosomal protein L29 [Legionella jordanis]VEH11441.1 50S ribosomal protein L29 [Legionella jordanis]HAT8714943.1 50S ribosomal protein L29 [Legionella jordanis]